ncbi:MAG: PTS glucose/sucrose transporter subunit IIB [Colwellia sp.]
MGTSAKKSPINSSNKATLEKVNISSHAELAAAILPLLGGKENITAIDNCITRLRLDVVDSSLIDKTALTKITAGVLILNKTTAQVIVGTEVEFVADEFRKLA